MLELLRAWFPNVLSVSVTTGVVLAVLLLAAPALAGRVKARWWCLAWVLLALRLDDARVGAEDYGGILVALSPNPVSDGGGYSALIGET